MLGMHLGIQREAAAPLNATFEEKAMVADSQIVFFFPQFCFAPFSFHLFFFLLSLWVRDTCRVHLLHLVAKTKSVKFYKTIVLLVPLNYLFRDMIVSHELM